MHRAMMATDRETAIASGGEFYMDGSGKDILPKNAYDADARRRAKELRTRVGAKAYRAAAKENAAAGINRAVNKSDFKKEQLGDSYTSRMANLNNSAYTIN